jgi:hypothetical protein
VHLSGQTKVVIKESLGFFMSDPDQNSITALKPVQR